MGSSAIDTLSRFGVGILCVVLGIMVLALFFSALSWLNSRGAKPETISVRGILKKDCSAKLKSAVLNIKNLTNPARERCITTSKVSKKTRICAIGSLNGVFRLSFGRQNASAEEFPADSIGLPGKTLK